MELQITIYGGDSHQDQAIRIAFESALQGSGIGITPAASPEYAQVIAISAAHPQAERLLAEAPHARNALFWIVEHGDAAAEKRAQTLLTETKVDEVLLAPFRELDVIAAFRRIEHNRLWNEVRNLNSSFKNVLDDLKSDLQIAERLQRARFPARFPEVKGFQIHHRYLAGLRSGGDHFDLAESKDGKNLSLVLTDSSSYGLSSAVLSALMRVMLKLTTDEVHSASDTIARLERELVATLGEKDRLAIFYGTLSRTDYRLRYVHVGQSALFYAAPGARFKPLPAQGAPLSRSALASPRVQDAELELAPNSRLVVLSDGFVESAGGLDACATLLNRFREREAVPLINELVFQVKSSFESADDLPGQDCTAAVLDVEKNALRRA